MLMHPIFLKLSRLFQPRNPQFWLLVVLNALSTAIMHILRTYEDIPVAITLLLAGFVITNALWGVRIALRLMADKPLEASRTDFDAQK